MSKTLLSFALGFPFSLISTIAVAQFHDQGMLTTPVAKTDFRSSQTGVASAPIAMLPCLHPDSSWTPCPTERTVYPQSNSWRQNWPCSADECNVPGFIYYDNWTVIFNNEPHTAAGNSGPPDQSLPKAAPGSGIMGFATYFGTANFPGDTLWRAHLVLNLSFTNPVLGGIPFLGFGEFATRHGSSNRTHLAYLNPGDTAQLSVLKFGSRLWSATLPTPVGTQPATLASYLFVQANWGTYPKAIFITLYHNNIQNSTPPMAAGINKWKWPITDAATLASNGSVFAPGAQIVYMDAEDVNYYCGFTVPSLALNQDVNYRIDLTSLFRCASNRGYFSEPMPTTANIPVPSILWANEGTGTGGGVWTDVHSMKVVSTTSTASADVEATTMAIAGNDAPDDGPEVAMIRAKMDSSCDEDAGCSYNATLARAGRETEIQDAPGSQVSRPDLIRMSEAMWKQEK